MKLKISQQIFLFVWIGFDLINQTDGLKNCPMRTIKAIIDRAMKVAGDDAPLQMQLIRRIMEDIYGGSWGVLIIKNREIVSSTVHWTIPDHRNQDGSAAFCLYAFNKWQYNVFKTGDMDTNNRMTVEEVVKRLNDKQLPERFSVAEFDRKMAATLQKRRPNAKHSTEESN